MAGHTNSPQQAYGSEPVTGTSSSGIGIRQAVRDALSDASGGQVSRFQPGRLPRGATWFTDKTDMHLIVVVDASCDLAVVDKIAAYALAWQHHRTLILVLPEQRAAPIRYRLPWIAAPVQGWTITHDGAVVQLPALTRDDSVARARAWPLHVTEDHDLQGGASWVAAFTDAADQHWALTPAHRSSYLAWHCAGRKVLQVNRVCGGIAVTAGVQYKDLHNRRPAQRLVLTGALTPEQRALLESALAQAIVDRVNAVDDANVEHRLQAGLAATDMPGMGLLSRPAREYPAWRPDKHRGFIDFLGIDRDNHLHIVETKVGPDSMLVFQVLDYLIWVTAHACEIRAHRGWPAAPNDTPVHVDLVLAPKGDTPAKGAYTACQLEALAPDVRWRVWIVTAHRHRHLCSPHSHEIKCTWASSPLSARLRSLLNGAVTSRRTAMIDFIVLVLPGLNTAPACRPPGGTTPRRPPPRPRPQEGTGHAVPRRSRPCRCAGRS